LLIPKRRSQQSKVLWFFLSRKNCFLPYLGGNGGGIFTVGRYGTTDLPKFCPRRFAVAAWLKVPVAYPGEDAEIGASVAEDGRGCAFATLPSCALMQS
jgi:hypothetical protein